MNYEYIAAGTLLAVFVGILYHQRSKSEDEEAEPEEPEDIEDPAHYEEILSQIERLSEALKDGLPAAEEQRALQQRGALMKKYEEDRKKAYPNGGGPLPLDEVLEA